MEKKTGRHGAGAILAALLSAWILWPGQVRAESLDGLWSLWRSETGQVPGPETAWVPVKVPSLVDQVQEKPFLWYKRSFTVPESFAGRRVFLHFGAVRFVSQVYVNGTPVGGHYGGWEPFEIEITSACQIGQPNELLVRVQDVRGVIEEDVDSGRKAGRLVEKVHDAIMAPVGSQYYRVGIWEPVSLLARNEVYVEDVFVKTSVRRKEIEVDVTLKNLGAGERTVRLDVKVEGTKVALAADEVAVPARASLTVTRKRPWADPRLWSPEDPHLYQLVTQVTAGGQELDNVTTRFGFREFWVDGPELVLNGTPMKFLATAGHPRGQLDDGLSKPAAIAFYRWIREAGCVAMRLHANVWPKHWYEAADEVGMPIIMESALFCYSGAYALSKPKFWENYHEHLAAMVRSRRNHPAIVMISLENEILHCGGERVPETVHRLAEAGRLVKRLDPTRPIMYDADGDPEGTADVVNLHYPFPFDKRNLWPEAGYWLETGMELASWPRTFWTWDRKKPLYFGEFLHLQDYHEADPYTVLLGDDAYLDHNQAMARCKAEAWRMKIEAYRAAGVSGMCPWTLTEISDPPEKDPRYHAVRESYEKNAAFVRQYDTRFYAGDEVDRTVYLYNDTPQAGTFTVRWWFANRGKEPTGAREFPLKPAGQAQFSIRLKMPDVKQPTAAAFPIQVACGDRTVYRRCRQYWVYPRRKLALPEGVRLALFEGQDRVLSRALAEAGLKVTSVTDLAELPAAEVLLIGPHALDNLKPPEGPPTVGDASGPRAAIAAFVRRGGSVLVLEQDSYDSGLLPGQLVGRGATIAFRRATDETLFAGLRDDDFRFWRGDNVVARKTLLEPQSGRYRALVASGGPAGLVYLPLLEVLDGAGRYLLCQLLLGEKLATEPAAQIMLENLIRYAVAQRQSPARLILVQNKLPLAERLGEIGAQFEDLSGRLARSTLDPRDVLLAEADSPELAADQSKVREFVAAGGRLLLHGATPEGLRRIAALFPEPVFAQRNNAVPVSLVQPDPAINGLSNQQLYWYGSRQGLDWHTRTPLSTDVARYVIVAGLPDPCQTTIVEAESMTLASGEASFNKEDVYFWIAGSLTKQLDFPQSGEYTFLIRGRGTPVADVYPQIELRIDGRRCGSITTDGRQWGEYALSAFVPKGSHEVAMAFVNDAWDPDKGEDRNVSLDRLSYAPTPALRSKRLLSPAALVKVPLGKGYYLLDQVAWDQGSGGEKAARYLSCLLTNLGCDFESPSGVLRIAADQMEPDQKTSLFVRRDGMASLGTNGTIACTVRFAQSRAYRFAIRASGTEAGGEYPNIALSIDGKPVGNVSLRRPDWQVLRLEAEVPAGEHRVGLSFTNDYYDPPADRNLVVGELSIR